MSKRDLALGELQHYQDYPEEDNLKFIVAHPRTKEQRPIPVAKLGRALSLGFTPAQNEVSVAHPKTGEVRSISSDKLQKALSLGFNIPEPGLKDLGQAGAQGVAKGLGNLADTAVAAGSAALSKSFLYKGFKAGADALGVGESYPDTEQLQEQAKDYWKNPKLEQAGSDYFQNNITTPGLEAAKVGGEFVAGIPQLKGAQLGVKVLTNTGKLANLPWINKLNKFLEIPLGDAKSAAKTVASFAGAGAGSELIKSNDPNVGTVETIARDVLGITLGSAAGSAIPNASMKATKAVANALTNPIDTLKSFGIPIKAVANALPNSESIKDFGISIAALPFRGKVNERVYKNAKELGIELTPAMLTDSNLAKLTENSLFNSIFTAKAYKETIDNIPESIIKAIDVELTKTLGPRVEASAMSSVSSTLTQNTTQQLEKNVLKWKENSKQLFNNSIGKLTANDKLAVPKTIETIDSMLERLTSIEKLKEGVKRQAGTQVLSDEQGIINVLTNVRNELLPKSTIEGVKQPYVELLVNKQQQLMDLGKYGQEVGAKNYYNGVAGALIEELEKYTVNPAFHKDYKTARAFYKNYIVNGERAKITKSLLHQQSPREAIAFMNTAQNIKTMEKLVGNSKNGKQLMGTLKRGKIQEILEEGNVFTGNGDFNPDAFITMFSRQKKGDILQPLMGESYTKLKENLLPVAEAINNSKKVMNIPSVSNITQVGVLGGIYSLSGLAGAIGGLGARAGLIYSLSSAMANPKFTEKLIARSKSPRFSKTKAALSKTNSYVQDILAEPEVTAYVKDLLNNPAIKASALKTGSQILPYAVDNPLMDDYYNQSQEIPSK